jgi:hypothetical protein
VLSGKYRPGTNAGPDTRVGRADRRMMETEWRPESLAIAAELKAHAEKKGSSQVFDAAFDFPEEGDHLWIQSPGSSPQTRSIWIGSRADAEARSSRYAYHAVEGDFDGWFLAAALSFEWGLP